MLDFSSLRVGEVGWEGLPCEITPQWAVKKSISKFNASFNGRHLSRLGKYTTWSPAYSKSENNLQLPPRGQGTFGVVLGCSSWLWCWRAAWCSSSEKLCWGSPWGLWRAEPETLAWLWKQTHTRTFCELCLLWMLFLLPAQTKSLLRKSHDWIFISISVVKHWAHNWVCTTLGLSKTNDLIQFLKHDTLLCFVRFISKIWSHVLGFDKLWYSISLWLHIELNNKTKPLSLKHLFFLHYVHF